MSKQTLVAQIRRELEEKLAVMQAAAADAKENATGDETKSDGKYDTRAIEAGYLAGAQAEQAEKLAEAVRLFQQFDPPSIDDPSKEIGPGALVECEHSGEIVFYLLAPAGGGHTVEHEGFDCIVLSPESTIYQTLLGAKMGELLDDDALMVLEVS